MLTKDEQLFNRGPEQLHDQDGETALVTEMQHFAEAWLSAKLHQDLTLVSQIIHSVFDERFHFDGDLSVGLHVYALVQPTEVALAKLAAYAVSTTDTQIHLLLAEYINECF